MEGASKVLAIISLLAAWVSGFASGIIYNSSIMKREAIKQGYAEYSSQTGEWQWKKLND